MKKLALSLSLSLICLTSTFAQQTTSPNLQLAIPYNHETNWGPAVVGDLTIIDSVIGGTAPAAWSVSTTTPFKITNNTTGTVLFNLDLSGNMVMAGGGTFAGPVVLPGNPTTALQAAPKQYVDSSSGTAIAAAAAASAAASAASTAAAAAQTAAAAAVASSAQKASNLSDLTNVVTARTNLGLGSAATTSSSAYDASGAAAGVQATSLQKVSNLSDVADPATALANLGGLTSAQLAAAAATATANAQATSVQKAPSGSQIVTQPTGTYLTVNQINGAANLDTYVTGSGNNGQANALAAGVPFGFYPATSTSIESIGPYGTGTSVATAGLIPHLIDYRKGMDYETFNDVKGFINEPGASGYYAKGANCFWLTVNKGGGTGTTCMAVQNTEFGPGIDYGNGVLNNQGWSGGKALYVQNNTYRRGINQAMGMGVNCHNIGDCAGIYGYFFGYGGQNAPSDEGIEPIKINGGEFTQVFSGLSAVAGTGLTTVTTTSPVNASLLSDGGSIIDRSITLASGNVIAIANSGTSQILTTDDTHAASTAVGSLSANLTNTENQQQGNTLTFNVTMTTGVFQAGQGIVMACDDLPEEIVPTAVTGTGPYTVTAVVRHSHLAGCPMYQGGVQGSLDLVADRQFSNTIRTSYLVYGSTANTLLTKTYQPGGVAGIYTQQHNFGSTQYLTSVVRSGNVVTANFYGAGGVRQGLVGQKFQIVPTGSTNSNFAGTFTGATITNNGTSLKWTQSGTNDTTGSTATLNFGGAVGEGAYVVNPSAEVIEVLQTNQVANGGMTLAPNHMALTVGDQLEEPLPPTNHVGMMGYDGTFTTPSPNATNVGFSQVAHGAGVDANFFGQDTENQTPLTNYAGFGGLQTGPTYAKIGGPWAYGLFFANSPIPASGNGNSGTAGEVIVVRTPQNGYAPDGKSIYNFFDLYANGGGSFLGTLDSYNRTFSLGFYNPGYSLVFGSSTLSYAGSFSVTGSTALPAATTFGGVVLGSAAFTSTSAYDAAGTASGLQANDLLKANNLSDLANVATARTNLGLGSAATTASTAYDAAGAASAAQAAAIAVSLQKANNLSDLANVATARTNLGLGSAATTASTAYDAAGTAATAAAAAQANAIAVSLQRASNLSDLASPATARTNLGLGAAATHGATVTVNGQTCALDGTCTIATNGTVTLTGDVTGTSGANTVVAVHATTGTLDGVVIGDTTPSFGKFNNFQVQAGNPLYESHWTALPSGTIIAGNYPCWIQHADSGAGSGDAYATADCVSPGTGGVGGYRRYFSSGLHPIGSEVWTLGQQDDGGNEIFPGTVSSASYTATGQVTAKPASSALIQENSGTAYFDSLGTSSSVKGAFDFRCATAGETDVVNCLTGDNQGNWTALGAIAAAAITAPSVQVIGTTSAYNGSSMNMQWAGNNSYFYSMGTDSATQGGFKFQCASAGASLNTNCLSGDGSGDWTLPGYLASSLVGITNPGTASTNLVTAYEPNLGISGSGVAKGVNIVVGTSASNYNAAYLGLINYGSGSTSNRGTVGLYGGTNATFDQVGNWAIPGVVSASLGFVGDVTGNLTGNALTATNVPYSGLTGTVPTWNQNTTGNAATATNATGNITPSSVAVATAAGGPLIHATQVGSTYGSSAAQAAFVATTQGSAASNWLYSGVNSSGVVTYSVRADGLVTGSSFSGSGTGLTGLASGLSIGGNAANATTATNATGNLTPQSISGLSTLLLGWSSSSSAYSPLDVGISRIGPGTIAIGNGVLSNGSGEVVTGTFAGTTVATTNGTFQHVTDAELAAGNPVCSVAVSGGLVGLSTTGCSVLSSFQGRTSSAAVLTLADVTGLGTLSNATTGNASTASRLSGNPAPCSTGQVLQSITAFGVTTCVTPPGLQSFNGRTAAAVVPTTGDYTVGQVTGAAPLSNAAFTGSFTVNANPVCQVTGQVIGINGGATYSQTNAGCAPRPETFTAGTISAATVVGNSCTGGPSFSYGDSSIGNTSTGVFNLRTIPQNVAGWNTGSLHVIVTNTGTNFSTSICNSSTQSVSFGAMGYTFTEIQ